MVLSSAHWWRVSLQNLPTLQEINAPTKPSVTHKFTEGTLNPRVHIVNVGVKQNWTIQ